MSKQVDFEVIDYDTDYCDAIDGHVSDFQAPAVSTHTAKEMADLLSSLVIGVAFTSGMLDDTKDLRSNYLRLVKLAFSGLYDSGDAGNFHEELIAAVYAHLTGENFDALQAEWAADMDTALAQNRAFFIAQDKTV